MSLFRQNFTVPKDYAKVVAVVIAMHIQLFKAGVDVSSIRKRLFNKQFMEKNFGAEHKRDLRQEIQAGGYPDTGSGPYSLKLSYGDWYQFNILQRIHLNYVENISLASTSVLASGLVNPNFGVGVGVAYLIGRLFYGFFYKRERGIRNPGRVFGIILCHLAATVGFAYFFKEFFKK